MANLLPPYSKLHVIVFGSITLFACLILIFLFSINNKSLLGSNVTFEEAPPQSIRDEFEDQLQMAQDGKFDTVWVNEGFLIIDIRTPEEYAEAHISGALSAPVSQLQYAVFGPETELVVYSHSSDDIQKSLDLLADKEVSFVYTLNEPLEVLESEGYKISRNEK